VIAVLTKAYAFLRRDFLSEVSYRLAFVLQIFGMFLTLVALYFLTGMIDPQAEGLDGVSPFSWLLIGVAFQYYFSTALYSFSAKIRNEQVLGTLEAMLVSPTPTALVIFSSAVWDFVYGGIRVLVYLLFATLVFGVSLNVGSPLALALGLLLTLLSSAGLGIFSASFTIYLKRGNPINFLLSGATMLLGNVFFPVEQLPNWLRPLSDYLPITWSMRVIRGALLQGASFAELGEPLARLALLTVLLLPLGVLASRIAIRRAKREGSLVVY
jgi:ABC-2 type transport system permease protein